MKGLMYQLKSVRKDKFCIMSFLLPIIVAVALHFVGSIDLSSLGEFHFGVTEQGTNDEVTTWLERYGTVTVYPEQEELVAAINESSTNLIGVETDGDSIQTILSGDELEMFRQTANTLPALYAQREMAKQARVQVLERQDISFVKPLTTSCGMYSDQLNTFSSFASSAKAGEAAISSATSATRSFFTRVPYKVEGT